MREGIERVANESLPVNPVEVSAFVRKLVTALVESRCAYACERDVGEHGGVGRERKGSDYIRGERAH